jgi:anti-sigma factor RsiW
MPERCGRTFDEALLSGYVDRALTQADEQRVRIHIEDCAVCRTEVEQMTELKEVTMSSRFHVPSDDQWSEAPRGAASRLAFGVGWTLLIVWGVAVAGFALVAVLTSDEDLLEKLLAFSAGSGLVLLFLSVLIDRLKAMKTDRYREVQK